MATNELSWLSEDVEHTARSIHVALGGEVPAGKGAELRLTGLEPLVIAVALKAVVGVASGFAGRLLYDKWKAARTRKEIDEIAGGLSLKIAADLVPSVDEHIVREDVIDALTLEGLTPSQAKTVCDEVFERVWPTSHHAPSVNVRHAVAQRPSGGSGSR